MSFQLWAWGVAVRAMAVLRPAALRRRALAEAATVSRQPADDCQPAEAPWYTDEERDQIGALAGWWESADEDTRFLGADLAGHLRAELPDLPPPVVARVLLSSARRLEEMACVQDSDYSALRATADAMFGAPYVLAETGLALAGIDGELAELAGERP